MKTLTIGDLHGKNNWEDFEDIKSLINTPNLKTDFDYYIFLGDYTDSFTKSNVEILHNLNRLIQFKNNYPNKVILLLGNHDIQYIFTDYWKHICSGFRLESLHILRNFFTKNKDKFQLAFQIDNYLWSHAGVHNNWYNIYPYNSTNIAENLNISLNKKEISLFNVGYLRGGQRDVGGPLWCDKRMSSKNPLQGYHQIVGHTPVDTIKTIRFNFDKETSITYCDCIEHGDNSYYTLNTEDLWWPIKYDKNRNKLPNIEWKLCKDLETSHINKILEEVNKNMYYISQIYIETFNNIINNRKNNN